MNSSSLILAVLSLVAILHNHQAHALVHFCSNVQELRDAMATVLPGDHIVLAEGTTFKATDVAGQDIGAHYSSNVDGTPTDRITIRSENPDNRATLSGDKVGHLHVLRLFGNNWTIRDLIFTHAQKGIVLDHANNVHIVGCEVYYIGMEAIHIRDGSKNALIEDCFIHDTGESTAAYGEAIYVGSDKGVWGKYNPDVSGTIVRGCTIGPNVGAEAFDVKEGTSETIIEHNVVDATGLSGQGYADSFIDLKGTRTYVRYNVFYRNNADKLAKAIAIVKRPLPWGDMSTYEHVIHDNIFHLDDSGIDVVHAYSGFRDIYAFNNLPADGPIADGIYTTCCPPWYTPPPAEPSFEYDSLDYAEYDALDYSFEETDDALEEPADALDYFVEVTDDALVDSFEKTDDASGDFVEENADALDYSFGQSPDSADASDANKYGSQAINLKTASSICFILYFFHL